MQWFKVRVDYRRTKRLRAIEACEVSKPDENGEYKLARIWIWFYAESDREEIYFCWMLTTTITLVVVAYGSLQWDELPNGHLLLYPFLGSDYDTTTKNVSKIEENWSKSKQTVYLYFEVVIFIIFTTYYCARFNARLDYMQLIGNARQHLNKITQLFTTELRMHWRL